MLFSFYSFVVKKEEEFVKFYNKEVTIGYFFFLCFNIATTEYRTTFVHLILQMFECFVEQGLRDNTIDAMNSYSMTCK